MRSPRPDAFQPPKFVSIIGNTMSGVTSPTIKQGGVVGSKRGAVKRAQIVDAERLIVSAVPIAAVPKRCEGPYTTCENANDGNRSRVVARLNQAGETLLAQPFELVFRKRRTQRDVGHDGQRIAQPGDRDMEANCGGVDGARRAEVGSEKVNGVGDVERRS